MVVNRGFSVFLVAAMQRGSVVLSAWLYIYLVFTKHLKKTQNVKANLKILFRGSKIPTRCHSLIFL